ncbi:negative elongation factor b [Nannochloropsis oceanica]
MEAAGEDDKKPPDASFSKPIFLSVPESSAPGPTVLKLRATALTASASGGSLSEAKLMDSSNKAAAAAAAAAATVEGGDSGNRVHVDGKQRVLPTLRKGSPTQTTGAMDGSECVVDGDTKKRALPKLSLGGGGSGGGGETGGKKLKLIAPPVTITASKPPGVGPALTLKSLVPEATASETSAPVRLKWGVALNSSATAKPKLVVGTTNRATVTTAHAPPSPLPQPPSSATLLRSPTPSTRMEVVVATPAVQTTSPSDTASTPISVMTAAKASAAAAEIPLSPAPAALSTQPILKRKTFITNTPKSSIRTLPSTSPKELTQIRGPPVGNAAGRSLIKRGLREGDPRAFIHRFQAENGLLSIPEAGPALQMLDVLGVPRLQVYHNLFTDLRARLEERVDRCTDEQQLEKLLAQSFGYLTMAELKSIPERIIVKLRRVPARFLDRLAARPQILEGLPMKVKQQAWEAHPGLFRRGLVGMVDAYLGNRASVVMPAHDVVALLSLSSSSNRSSNSSSSSSSSKGVNTNKRRQDNPSIAQLVSCVNTDDNDKLEQVVNRYVLEEYASKGDPTLCTLFSDFQVSLAQARSGRATIITRLTHLARALEEWVKEGTVEGKGLIQVQVHLKAILATCDSATAAAQEKRVAAAGNGAGGVTAKAKGKKKTKMPTTDPTTGNGSSSSIGLTLKLPGNLSAAAAEKAWSKIPSLENALEDSMNYLINLDADTRWFAKPVWEVWPDIEQAYIAVVPHPMDLGTMKKRIKAGKEGGHGGFYTSFEAFDKDAERVFDNCMAFNPVGSTFYVGAERMKKNWMKYKVKFKNVDVKSAMEKRKSWGGGGGGAGGGGGDLVSKATTSTFVSTGEDIGGGGGGGGGGRDPTVPQPLQGRPRVEGQMWGQALMLLADPFVLHVLGKTVKQQLDEVYKSHGLPKDHPLLPSLLQLLFLGLDARRQLVLVLHKHKTPGPPAPPATPTMLLAKKGGKAGNVAPRPPNLPPGFSIPDARVSPLLVRDKDGELAAENDVQEAARTVLPSLLEIFAHVNLAQKYEGTTEGWEGQPHDKEEVQEKMLESVGRLYRSCKARQPSPLLLCMVSHSLCHSLATADDARTTPLAKTLAALLDHLNRKKKSEMLLATPDPQDRGLWICLASAGLLRVPRKKARVTGAAPAAVAAKAAGGAAVNTSAATTTASTRPPLDHELRDLLLSLFVKQLPFIPEPCSLSFCHEQVMRLLLGWMARGAFLKPKRRDGGGEADEEREKKEENAVKLWVGEIVQGVGGSKAVREAWEKERFQPMRRHYERLFEAEPWAKVLVWGEEKEEAKEGNRLVTNKEGRKKNCGVKIEEGRERKR